ncbi:DUF2802 domain-containing protein [Aromatoleum evansii]|uniref:DUF2802 domain-containing protein n=1 Tax=Aromatoleum evansii TaxID=59406 RepID=A0ABZ1AJL4_AROEV|nr:DUF2802 domain-containing protein [Aromatoleum evansii]NMG32107.1 DUF2802 domain-containing protein [Aromatoleum evansii]WRL46065.1 DUF2802 domain-containing protein [Aromatoleum evansii]
MGLRELILAAIALLAVYVGYQLYRASRAPRMSAPGPDGTPAEAPALAEIVVAESDDDDEPGPLYGRERPAPAPAGTDTAPDAFQHELEVRQLRRELEQQGSALADLKRELDEVREQLRAHKEQADAGLVTRGASPEYNEALVFARRGLAAEAIAERCGITVAEAELVQSLARSQGGESGNAQ